LSKEQRALSKEQRALSKEQRALGKEQRALRLEESEPLLTAAQGPKDARRDRPRRWWREISLPPRRKDAKALSAGSLRLGVFAVKVACRVARLERFVLGSVRREGAKTLSRSSLRLRAFAVLFSRLLSSVRSRTRDHRERRARCRCPRRTSR